MFILQSLDMELVDLIKHPKVENVRLLDFGPHFQDFEGSVYEVLKLNNIEISLQKPFKYPK